MSSEAGYACAIYGKWHVGEGPGPRANEFITLNAEADTPFFLYFNHSLMHMPVIPRVEFKGKTGQGDWADSLLELDCDFGVLLDLLDELDLVDDTLVVFAGDNGPEEILLWRGWPGYWEGSYFAGGEGNLRTPCSVRWPERVREGALSDESMHVTDWFTTILHAAGVNEPTDRVIDGVDQLDWLAGTRRPQRARDTSTGWARRSTGSSGATSSWPWSSRPIQLRCATRPTAPSPTAANGTIAALMTAFSRRAIEETSWTVSRRPTLRLSPGPCASTCASHRTTELPPASTTSRQSSCSYAFAPAAMTDITTIVPYTVPAIVCRSPRINRLSRPLRGRDSRPDQPRRRAFFERLVACSRFALQQERDEQSPTCLRRTISGSLGPPSWVPSDD